MRGRILIVDDDPVAMEMLEDALKLGGFEVVRAYGAEDALRKARLQRPDLVLTDLEMPKVTGVGLIAMIREDPNIQTKAASGWRAGAGAAWQVARASRTFSINCCLENGL